jgi:cation diffusion facilitator CzcD-associated flavoprotein CzcO
MLPAEVTMSRRKRTASIPERTSGPPEQGRFSARRKLDAVLQLLRGEELDALSRKLGVTAATLSQWREQVLAAGRAGLKSRLADERDEEIQRLRAKIGEMTMANELLRERSRAAEAHRPLAPRRRNG